MPKDKTSPPKKPAAARTEEAPAAEPADHSRHDNLLRRILAGILGALTISVIVSTLIFGWLNSSLLNGQRYVAAVSSLAQQPRIQNYAIDKISQKILDSTNNPADAQALARSLGLANPPAIVLDQLKAQLAQPVRLAVAQAVESPAFAQTWQAINQDLHDQLITIASSSDSTATLNLRPSIDRLNSLLQSTRLGAGNSLKPDKTSVDLNASQVQQLRKSYTAGRDSYRALLILAVLLTAATLAIANQRLKALRHLAIWVGLSMVLVIVAIKLPSHLSLSQLDANARGAFLAAEQTLLRGLLKLAEIVVIICLVITAVTSWWLWRAGRERRPVRSAN